MMKRAAALFVLLALGLSGCHRGAGPPSPPPEAARQDHAPSDSALPKIRQAVRELMKEAYPGSNTEGVWILQFRDNYCLAGADATFGGQRQTIDLLVRLYVRENGSEYWRAESLGRGFAEFLERPSELELQRRRPGQMEP